MKTLFIKILSVSVFSSAAFAEVEEPIRCVETEAIASYKVENDELVKIILTDRRQLLMRLKNRCPQLYFHKYISYTPTDGRICAGVDEIRNRAGLSCRIGSFETISQSPVEAPTLPTNNQADDISID